MIKPALLLILAAALVAACAPEPAGPDAAAETAIAAPTVDTIDGASLAARLDDADAPLILDVRSTEEFAEGHIPGALNIPHTELAGRMSELPAEKNAEIVVHCRSGRRAEAAEQILLAAGYSDVKDLQGHMLGWVESGLPVADDEDDR